MSRSLPMAEILSPFTAKAETWGQRLSIVMILPLRSTRSAEPTEPRQEKSVKITVNIVIKIRNSFLIKSGTLRLLIYKSNHHTTNKKPRYLAGLDVLLIKTILHHHHHRACLLEPMELADRHRKDMCRGMFSRLCDHLCQHTSPIVIFES